MSGVPPVPSFSDAEVIARLRRAAQRGLSHSRNGDTDLLKYGFNIEGANELIAECSEKELNKHELSDRYPEYNDYIVVLKIDLEGERHPFYVKVALRLPDLESGELLSFHEWGLQR